MISSRPPDMAPTRCANFSAATPTPGVSRGQGMTMFQRLAPCAIAGAAERAGGCGARSEHGPTFHARTPAFSWFRPSAADGWPARRAVDQVQERPGDMSLAAALRAEVEAAGAARLEQGRAAALDLARIVELVAAKAGTRAAERAGARELDLPVAEMQPGARRSW